MSWRVRPELPADRAAVQSVNQLAFETLLESNLVDALREHAQPVVSLVAEDGGTIVGHIMFSPVTLDDYPEAKIMGLAPMAVSPILKRRGIGSELVRSGLKECEKLGCGAVVVLGHPEYYPRFGFNPATRFGIGCPYDVPEDVFMAIELEADYLDGVSGVVRYHPAFDAAT